METSQIQNLDLPQHGPDPSVEPANCHLLGPGVLELTVLPWAVTPCRHCQAGIASEPPTISVVLLFCTKEDVLRYLAIEYASELFMRNDAASLSLRRQDRVQEAIRRDEKSVVFARPKCEDHLAHGTRVQVVFTPQTIQKLEVGEMEEKVGPRIDCDNTLRESEDERRIKAQQSGRVISCLHEQGMKRAKSFGVAFVPCPEHLDLRFSRVGAILQGNNKPYLVDLLLVHVIPQRLRQLQ